MITPPYVFVKDITYNYNKYKICEINKRKFIECINNYIIKDKYENCNQLFDVIKKYKCL